MCLVKVKEIVEWPSLGNILEVGSFGGLESFYRKFIRNFRSIYAPIVETIEREHQPFEWTEETKRGFMLLKQKIIQKLIFALPDFKKLFEVKCDSSGIYIRVVLRQEERPITYLSEKL